MVLACWVVRDMGRWRALHSGFTSSGIAYMPLYIYDDGVTENNTGGEGMRLAGSSEATTGRTRLTREGPGWIVRVCE